MVVPFLLKHVFSVKWSQPPENMRLPTACFVGCQIPQRCFSSFLTGNSQLRVTAAAVSWVWQSPSRLLTWAVLVLPVGPNKSKSFVHVLNYRRDILLISALLLFKMPSLEKRHRTDIYVLDHKSNGIYWYWRDVSEWNTKLMLYIANLLHSPTAADQGAVESPKYFLFYKPNLKLRKAKQRGNVKGHG